MTTTTESHSYSPNWGKAVIAGIVATVAITLTMALFGQNILKMLGSMIAPQSGATMQYIAGGIMHFAVGIVYALIFAWLLGPVRARGPVVKGVLYGLAITAIALALMPVMSQAMPGGGAGNPCNPCGAAASNPCNPCSGAAAANPCNPCNPCSGAKADNPCNPCGDDHGAMNPCNPCGEDHGAMNPCNPCGEDHGAMNPCNPCGEDYGAMNPCNPCNPCSGAKTAANPCNPCGGAGNPCNPCGGGGSPYSSLISAVNHIVYGLVLALVYGRD